MKLEFFKKLFGVSERRGKYIGHICPKCKERPDYEKKVLKQYESGVSTTPEKCFICGTKIPNFRIEKLSFKKKELLKKGLS